MSQLCHVVRMEKTVDASHLALAHRALLAVSGMGCVNCANRVRNSLLGLDRVIATEIDLERGIAVVDYLPANEGMQDLINAVSAAGNDGRHSYQAVIIS